MDTLKQLLNEKKYDEAIIACADDGSYEKLIIKAQALMYKREYAASAEAFVQATNITENFEKVEEFLGFDIGQLYFAMSDVYREENKETLAKFDMDNDVTKLIKIPITIKAVSGAMESIIKAANKYAPMGIEVYNIALLGQYKMMMDIASDLQDFSEAYSEKVAVAYNNMLGNNGGKPTNDMNAALQLLSELKNITEMGKYTRILLHTVTSLLNMVITSPTNEKYLDDIKSIYKRAIATMRKMIDLSVTAANGNTVLLFDYGSDSRKEYITDLGKYELALKDLDPEYQPQPLPVVGESDKPKTASANSSGGCYVATAVYGSYDCPEVWTLRRFRDNVLSKSAFGRAFVYTYYAISPTLVKLFGNTEWFKKLWRKPLDKMVGKLNDKGTENTPYDDIVW